MHRVRQGLRGLFGFAFQPDYALAERYLTPDMMVVFKEMSRGEQLHSLHVLRDVLAQASHTPHDLAVAALMHDSGKSRYQVSTLGKTYAVALREIAPGLHQYLAREGPESWLARPCAVAVQHAKWSAEIMTKLGANERIIWLVRNHQSKPEKWEDHPNAHLMRRLQAADNAN